MTIVTKCPILNALFGPRNQLPKKTSDTLLYSPQTEYMDYDLLSVPIPHGSRRLMTRYVEYYIPTMEVIHSARELTTQFY